MLLNMFYGSKEQDKYGNVSESVDKVEMFGINIWSLAFSWTELDNEKVTCEIAF
jgi:hypothetical protein